MSLIKDVMSGTNLGVAQIARLVGVHRGLVYDWMHGSSPCDAHKVRLLNLYLLTVLAREKCVIGKSDHESFNHSGIHLGEFLKGNSISENVIDCFVAHCQKQEKRRKETAHKPISDRVKVGRVVTWD